MSIRQGILFFLVILFCVWAYLTGLPGGFLLDDHVNLSVLERVAHIDWHSFVDFFALQSIAGPTGRPISLLSFFLQYQSWPNFPGHFKLVNIAIHLLSGLLLTRLAYLILRRSTWHHHAVTIALWIGAIWLLHPLNVSTTLYVVQRMTGLASLFMLAGCVSYFSLRDDLERGYIARAYWKAGLLLLPLQILALFSKESGAMLPIYLFVIEHTLYRRGSNDIPQRWVIILRGLLWLTIVALLVLLASPLLHPQFPNRDFTAWERLLTEPRVLCNYLQKIVLPRVGQFTLFHDDVKVSQSLLDPWTTLPALVFIYGSLVACWLWRRRQPLLALGGLWFLLGHALESTSLNLELVFEHRNYLPMFGIVLLLVVGIFELNKHFRRIELPRIVLPAYLALIALMLLNETSLWRNAAQLQLTWAKRQPESQRAQHAAAVVLVNAGKIAEAEKIVYAAALRDKNVATWAFYVGLPCFDANLALPPLMQLVAKFNTVPYSLWVPNTLGQTVEWITDKQCDRAEPEYASALTNALLGNSNYQSADVRADLLFIRAQLAASMKMTGASLKDLDEAHRLSGRVEYVLIAANALVDSGDLVNAARYIALAQADIAAGSTRNYAFRENLLQLEKKYTLAINRQNKSSQ